MSFIFEPLRKYADFQGRARRAEFWQFLLAIMGVFIVGGILVGLADAVQSAIGSIVASIILAVVLVGLIPYAGQFVLLVFYVIDGNKGENRFGPDPKGRERDALVAA